MDQFIICECESCQGHIEFPAEGVDQCVECPHCECETMLVEPLQIVTHTPPEGNPIPTTQPGPPTSRHETSTPAIPEPRTNVCKTCGLMAAPSAEICVHCGQVWPTWHAYCPDCGANDFDVMVEEDDSEYFFSLDVAGIIGAAVAETLRSEPQPYFQCRRCAFAWVP